MNGDTLWKVFIALAPTVGILFLFYQVMKGVLEGDRRERIAHAQWEREQDAAAATGASAGSPTAPVSARRNEMGGNSGGNHTPGHDPR